MKIDFAGRSCQGRRMRNEDSFLMCADENRALLLVADGIGGKRHGEAVSRALRDGYAAWWSDSFEKEARKQTFPQALEGLRGELYRVNRSIVQQYGEMNAGSTLVLLFLFEQKYAYISAGDSRIYRSRGLSFRQITRDDIYENLPEKPKDEQQNNAGKLAGAVGIHVSPQFSVHTGILRRNDRFFLCSDGVYRYLAPGKLKRAVLLRGCVSAPERLVSVLASEVERNQPGDNYTMIFARVREL